MSERSTTMLTGCQRSRFRTSTALVRAMIALVFGVAATLIIAGPLAECVKRTRVLRRVESHRDCGLDKQKFNGAWEIDRVESMLQESWTVYFPGQYVTDRASSTVVPDLSPPNWVFLPNESEQEQMERPFQVTTSGIGWPLSAFRVVEWTGWRLPPGVTPSYSAYVGTPNVRGAAVLDMGALGAWRLPYHPIWPGLIADVAWWAVFGWCAMALARFVRKALRTRRGLCETCAYNREGFGANTPCPECGN